MASEREARLEAALRKCAQQLDDDGRPCWCRIPSMIPYRGHYSGCEAARASLAAPPDQERPLDEKHVQYATVSQPLMSAMCAGEWRIGPIIFEAPGGHGSFSAWAILAPWPWLRAGKDTPYAAVERFLAACPPEPPGCSHHGPGCPDPQPYPPSAPPPVTPGEDKP